MRTLLTLGLIGSVWILNPPAAGADEETPPPAGSPFIPTVSGSVDVVPYAFRGYSIWLGVGAAPHWGILLGSFAGDTPPLGLPEGWNPRFSGHAMFVQFFFSGENRGLFVGLGLGLLQWQYRRDDTPGAVAVSDDVFVAPMVGFRWFPARTAGFFVQPFLGLGVPFWSVGDTSITTQDGTADEYESPAPVTPLPGLFFGWELGRR